MGVVNLPPTILQEVLDFKENGDENYDDHRDDDGNGFGRANGYHPLSSPDHRDRETTSASQRSSSLLQAKFTAPLTSSNGQ